jgi:hypothetical protein
MNLRNIIVAGAVLALASPVAALAQSPSTLTPAQAKDAVLGRLSSYDRTQVVNILGLLQGGQIDRQTAAVQIDGVLSDADTKTVLSVAGKVPSLSDDAQDAGAFLVDLEQPPSK